MLYDRVLMLFCIVLLIISASPATSPAEPPQISAEEARGLVYEGLKVYTHNNNVAKIEVTRIENKYDPTFYYFDTSWPDPSGSGHLGYFAINPWTGDIWNAAGCGRLESHAITRLKREIRRHLTMKDREYSALAAKKPLCNNE